MRRAPAFAAMVVVPLAAVLAGCESSQDKSARLEAQAGTILLEQEGLEVTRESTDVKVVDTAVLTDKYGSAAVITVRNDSGQDLVDVPISIDVRGKNGASVFRNDLPGLEQALIAVPLVPAGETVDWVHDQVLATGTPAAVKAKIGASTRALTSELPDLDVGDPKLIEDPVSGTEATGPVINRSGEEQREILLYAVARKGEEIVAAGRGVIPRIKSNTKPVDYHIFFIGDPRGADIAITVFPRIETKEQPDAS